MTAPTPPIQDVVNDPNYVPLCTHTGDILVTDDGTVLIVSTTLRVHGDMTYGNRGWLKAPPFRVRQK